MKKMLTIFLCFATSWLIAQDSTKTLEPILVTSVRASVRVPVSQKTIYDSSIQRSYQGQEIPMLLGNLTSVYTNCDGGNAIGYSYFSIRGIDQTRINVTLNSVPLNEPEDMGVYTSNYPSFTTSIHSIQIQRGVGASSNGTSSFGGSINFQSKDGLKKGGELQLGGGSFNTSRFDASYSTGLRKGFALFTNIGGITTSGFRNNSGSRGGSVFLSGGYYTEKNVTKLSILSGMSKNNQAWQGSSDSVLENNYRDNPRGGDDMDDFKQTHIQLQNITVLPKIKLTNTLFYNYLDGRYNVGNLHDFKDISSSMFNYFATETQYSRWWGGITQGDYKRGDIGISGSITASTYTRFHQGFEIFDTTTLDHIGYKNSGNKDDISGFLKFSYDNKKVLLYLDVQERWATYKYKGDTVFSLNWNFFNPKIGAKIFLSKKLDVYWSMGISHREPTRTIMFSGNFYATNPLNLISLEEVIDNEIGVNYSDDYLKIQADCYYMKFSNEMIAAGPIGYNSLPFMMNVPNSQRYGVEFDGKYHTKNLIYEMNTTLSDGEFKVDSGTYKYLFNPHFMLKQALTYNVSHLSFTLNHAYISKVFIDKSNQNTLPINSTIGANITYTVSKYQISLQGNNLLGAKTYSNGYYSFDKRYRISNALQNYYVTLRIKL